MKQKNLFNPILTSYLRIGTDKRGVNYIEIRKIFTEPHLIKILISSALNDNSLIVSTSFKNKHIAISNLINKGILCFNEKTQKYEFTY